MISRSQMNRQLYEGGGISTLQQARNILEAEALPGESLAYINPQEAAMLKYMGGAGIPVNSSGIPSYFIKSIGKAISGAVKGATKAVKSIVSSDVGKLALLAAGGYYLGGGNLLGLQRAGMSGFSFGNLPGATMLKNVAAGAGFTGMSPTTPLMPTAYKVGSTLSNVLSGGNLLSAGIGLAGGVLGSLFGSKEQAVEAFKRNPTAVKSYLAQYYKNTNQDASDEEVNEFVESQTREYAAQGGLMGRQEYGIGGMITEMINNNPEIFKKLQMASPIKRYQAQYMQNLNPEMDEEEVIEYLRENSANGGRIGFAFGNMPMGEPRENQGGIMELDYRNTGGFVPVGIKEKADDVPAMLSKNEFVFTADAVRNAGGGDVEKGAQRLYNTMKTLENGGTV